MSDALSVPATPEYPRIGPLLATAFDRAVRVTMRSWVWIVVVTLLCLAGARYAAAQQALNICLFIWTFVAAANAMRTIRPEYRMTGGTVGRMFLAAFAAGLVTLVGVLLLVVPGVYVATKFSMAQAAVVNDDLPGEAALRTSWELTTGRFWRTLLFCIACLAAVYAVLILIGLLVGIGAGMLVVAHIVPGTLDQAAEYGTALTAPLGMYAEQAQWIASLYWYRALKAMAEGPSAPNLAPA